MLCEGGIAHPHKATILMLQGIDMSDLYSRHTLIEKDHTSEEYSDFQAKLAELNDDQIIELATALAIKFDPESNPTRSDYEAVLDESYWDEFYREYSRIVSKGK